MHITWFELVEIACLAVAIFCWRGLRRCQLSAFIPLLLIANAAEFLGINHQSFGWANNYFIYNAYLVLSTPFWFYICSKMLFLTPKERIVYYILCLLSLVLICFNYFFIQGPWLFNTFSLVLIDTLSIIFASLSLVRMAVLDEEQTRFVKHPYFWINAVSLLYCLVTLVLLGLQQYIQAHRVEIQHNSLYHAILPAVSIVLYSTYIGAFMLCRIQEAR
jgi:NADH:ubiquinone oxidoreductase subunit 6 (subunit J)